MIFQCHIARITASAAVYGRAGCITFHYLQFGRALGIPITTTTTSFFKGIVQPFELGSVTSLIRSAVRFCKAGHFQKKILMIQSHERSLKQNSAA
jgi:hypothetical protein